MPEFTYKAKAPSGSIVEGTMEAPQKSVVVDRLREKRMIVLEIKEKKESALTDLIKKINPFKGRVVQKDLVIFSRQLATMVSAGVPIVQGLSILSEQIENPYFKEIVEDIREEIESGSAIADAMNKHPDAFNNLFVNMIKAGELGGILDVILERLADYLESASDLKGKVKGALVYPAVVSTIALAVTIFLMVVIIPTFAEVFSSFGKELPMPTQVMINISEIMRKYIVFIILGIVSVVVGTRQFYKTDKGSKIIDAKILDVPIFGLLLRKVAIAKFTRTFGTLVKSGVPILEALDTVAMTAGNRKIEGAVLDAREAIREGEKIGAPLTKSGVFPPMVMQMISVGEETGNLDMMLSKIADFYDAEVDVAVEGLTSMIEPIVIVFMGIVIGAIVIAMFMPILSMGTLVS
ncbi:MAG: type II secretion system F family protein [Elusimicrobia bacterium]|jgi:type IV pilus assembly protein PilC|nr:type II secretion system F family protein [Elusimicrobiota bacterium]